MNLAAAAERFVTTWQSAWDAHDVDALLALYTRDCVHRSMPFRPAHTGRAAVASYLESTFATERPVSVRFGPPLPTGPDMAVAEFFVQSLETDAVGEVRPATLAGCVFVRFTPEGLAAETRDYWHTAEGHQTPDGPLFMTPGAA